MEVVLGFMIAAHAGRYGGDAYQSDGAARGTSVTDEGNKSDSRYLLDATNPNP